jgi:hypothetical protein
MRRRERERGRFTRVERVRSWEAFNVSQSCFDFADLENQVASTAADLSTSVGIHVILGLISCILLALLSIL